MTLIEFLEILYAIVQNDTIDSGISVDSFRKHINNGKSVNFTLFQAKYPKIEFLKEYPLSICLPHVDSERKQNRQRLLLFIMENKGTKIPLEGVT